MDANWARDNYLTDMYLEADWLRQELNALTDSDLIDRVLTANEAELNNVVTGGHFPAHDIAKRIKENGWTPSEKQRIALTNVYVHLQCGTH